MVCVEINGKQILADEKLTILEAALSNGTHIPHLCFHPHLSTHGACGLCVVEIQRGGEWTLVKACTTRVQDGLSVYTETDLLKSLRLLLFELILSTHSADCGTCIKYQNCELQSLKQYFKLGKSNLLVHPRSLNFSFDEAVLSRDPNKCILCGRCVRACEELRGVKVLKYRKDNGSWYIAPECDFLKSSGCQFCGACAEVCPTAAIVDKKEFLDGKRVRKDVSPCLYACPAGVNIPFYVESIARGEFKKG